MASSNNFDLVGKKILKVVGDDEYRVEHYQAIAEFSYVNPEKGIIIALMSPGKKIKILYNQHDYKILASKDIDEKLVNKLRIFIGIDYPVYGVLGVVFFEAYSENSARTLVRDLKDYLEKLEKIKTKEITDNSSSATQVALEFELFHDKFEHRVDIATIENIEIMINKVIKKVKEQGYNIKKIKCSDFSDIVKTSNMLYGRDLELIISRKEMMRIILTYSITENEERFEEICKNLEKSFLAIVKKDNALKIKAQQQA